MEYDHKSFLHHLANSNKEMVLEGKVRVHSAPAERMQITGCPAEFLMQIGLSGRLASVYWKDIVSPVLVPDEAAPFWKSDSGDCSECLFCQC